MQRVSCIDIGTVTGRLAIADVENDRVLRMAKQTTICDLGEGLSATGRISDAARERVVSCVDAYLTAVRSTGTPVVCCTLTSAARDAENADELLDALAARGIEPQIIPGEVEGKLTFLGMAQDFQGSAILAADNGGGSTEFALGKLENGAIDLAFVRSFDVGCRRVTERFLSEEESGIPTPEALAAAHEFAAELFSPVAEMVAESAMKPERLIACGGTVTSLIAMDAHLVPYDSSFVHLSELTLEQVDRMEAQLARMEVAERARIAGLQPKRAAVILGGTIAVSEILRATGFDRLTVSESDLLFGLAITMAAVAEGKESPVGWMPSLTRLYGER
ncbi:MAG: phosphatase [Atopobiaceae bacterium]|nr:phosphatase [Atopobiaceae bacterium]